MGVLKLKLCLKKLRSLGGKRLRICLIIWFKVCGETPLKACNPKLTLKLSTRLNRKVFWFTKIYWEIIFSLPINIWAEMKSKKMMNGNWLISKEIFFSIFSLIFFLPHTKWKLVEKWTIFLYLIRCIAWISYFIFLKKIYLIWNKRTH